MGFLCGLSKSLCKITYWKGCYACFLPAIIYWSYEFYTTKFGYAKCPIQLSLEHLRNCTAITVVEFQSVSISSKCLSYSTAVTLYLQAIAKFKSYKASVCPSLFSYHHVRGHVVHSLFPFHQKKLKVSISVTGLIIMLSIFWWLIYFFISLCLNVFSWNRIASLSPPP